MLFQTSILAMQMYFNGYLARGQVHDNDTIPCLYLDFTIDLAPGFCIKCKLWCFDTFWERVKGIVSDSNNTFL